MAIHQTAIVGNPRNIDPTADIGPYAVIDEHVTIGAGTRVGPHVHITGWTTIGDNCRIHSSAVIGDEPQDRAFDGTESYCRIGNNVIIREHATIHRGTGEGTATIIGNDCFLMADSHVAHNCVLGNGVTLINSVLLAGHVTVADRAIFGGGGGAHQFCRVGELAMVAGHARILGDLPPFCMTNQYGLVQSINAVGLRRAGFSAEERMEIKTGFKILYRQGLPFRKAVDLLAETVTTEPGKRMLAFVQSETKRGFLGRAIPNK